MIMLKRRAMRCLGVGLGLFVACGGAMAAIHARTGESHPGECVVLLHGLGRTACSMKILEWNLRWHGYQVVNLSYPSRRLSIEELGSDWLPGKLAARQVDKASRVHFVTHSMGGIVARQYFAGTPLSQVGRVVMLAPPNQGSEVVDHLEKRRWFRRLMGPAAVELGTGEQSVPRRLGPARFETGVVAADKSRNPLFSAWLPGPDDGRVTVESTRLAGTAAHLVVHTTHAGILCKPAVMNAVISFIKKGSFM